MPVLRALGGLLRPRAPAGEEEGGAPAPAKLRALGLVEPPLEVLRAAVSAVCVCVGGGVWKAAGCL
jgi:hypothetical protein